MQSYILKKLENLEENLNPRQGEKEMKRFVISQLIEMIDRDDTLYRHVGEKDVMDTDTYVQAQAWIEEQNEENTYVIRDQYQNNSGDEEEAFDAHFPMSFSSDISHLDDFYPYDGSDDDQYYDTQSY